MRARSDVYDHLEESGIRHEMLPFPDRATTAERAADLLGVAPATMLKIRSADLMALLKPRQFDIVQR